MTTTAADLACPPPAAPGIPTELPSPPAAGFLAVLTAAYRRAGLPNVAHLDISYRCDLDCVHCYLDNKTTWPELNPTEFSALLHQLHDCGVLWLRWSGGEVFQRPDFLDQLRLAARLGFRNRVKTHGGNVTAERAAVLATCSVDRVDVSVYSLHAEIHDKFVRRPGALAATLAGIAHLRAAGLVVRVSTTLQPGTIAEVPALHAYFTALGCMTQFSTDIFRDHSASDALDDLQLSPAERAQAIALVRRVTGEPDVAPAALDTKLDRDPCSAGRTLVYIAPDGGVWPCVNFPMALGNVRDKPLREIWQASPERQALLAWTNRERTDCHGCGGSGFCFYCPGEAYKMTGDFRKAPATFHARTRARMAAFEDATSQALGAAVWSSTPEGGGPVKPPTRFAFPIYRPRKGGGARVLGGS